VQAWPLTGRAEELNAIAEVLAGDGEDTGVVIAGRAGVGKTRLAREAVTAASGLGFAVTLTANASRISCSGTLAVGDGASVRCCFKSAKRLMFATARWGVTA
jgi:MoxR-like ATPase